MLVPITLQMFKKENIKKKKPKHLRSVDVDGKYLLCEQEDLSSDAIIHLRRQGMDVDACNSSAGRQRQEGQRRQTDRQTA